MDKTIAVKAGFGAAVLGVVALAAPLLWALASAGVATFVIVIVGLAIAGLVKSIPLLGQKLENRILAAPSRARPRARSPRSRLASHAT